VFSARTVARSLLWPPRIGTAVGLVQSSLLAGAGDWMATWVKRQDHAPGRQVDSNGDNKIADCQLLEAD